MKKTLYLILALFPLLTLSACGQNNNIENQNYNAARSSSSINNVTQEQSTPPTEEEKQAPTETTLCEFSTPIKSKSSNRLNNIQITCQTLNGKTVNNGEEFSFCQTVGQVSSSKGYKLADVIINKQIKQALGGGMCQVSTTLYNAVLAAPSLQVTERHQHDKPVNYIEAGMDATVSYGSKDFKFVNNSGKTIKIYANADNGVVYVKIATLE